MSCNQPVWRKNAKGLLRPTPCKRCMGCRNDRREDFTNRLQLDYSEYGYIGSFITLTYRNECLPQLLPLGSAVVGEYFNGVIPQGTLYKPDVQKFFDNLNHKVKKLYNRSIKYVCAGEYGDDVKRPHYHAIVLGLPITDRQLVYDTWSKGIIDIAPVSHADIRYTLAYIDKEIFGADSLYKAFGDFAPPFGLFSKGLGMTHYYKHKDEYDETGRFYFSPDSYFMLNNYYKTKFGKINDSKAFSDNVIRFAQLNGFSDLYYADVEYHRLREEKIIHSERSKHKVIHNTLSDETFNFFLDK